MNNFVRCKQQGDRLEDLLAGWLWIHRDMFDCSQVRVVETAGPYDIELVKQQICEQPLREAAKAATSNGQYDIVRMDHAAKCLELAQTVQVKHDVEYQRTGRIAIELAYREAASGIQAPDAARWWAYGLGGTSLVYLMYRQTLREFIATHRPQLQYLHGGDRNDSYLVLIPVTLLSTESSFLRLNLEETL